MSQKLPESPEKAKQQASPRETQPGSAPSFQGGLHPIAQLQRTLGNRNVAKLLQAKRLTPEGKIIDLQRKLTVGAADDQYEQEADRVTRQGMNTPDAIAANSVQRAMSPEEDKDKVLQTKPLAESITPFVQREVETNEGSNEKVTPNRAMLLTHTDGAVLQRQQGLTSPVPPVSTGGETTAGSPVARPDRSALRTIADVAINAEYQSGARDGLADFESIVGSDLDAGAMMTNLSGNVIWAAACFATGGSAFAISLVGIGVSTGSPLASTSVDRAEFHQFAGGEITRITNGLLDQIDRITSHIDAEATQRQWDDTETRMKLLLAIFRPEFIRVGAGGIPAVNRAAIAHRVCVDLLTRANTFSRGLLIDSGARVIYDYTVSNYSDSHGIWPFDSTTIRPESQWAFSRGGTQLYVSHGGEGALAQFRQEALLQPGQLPFGKSVYIYSGSGDDIAIHLDANNAIYAAYGYGAFENLGAPPPRPAARTPPPPADPIGYAQRICSRMWANTGGLPPWVRGQDLSLAIFPGRSRATR